MIEGHYTKADAIAMAKAIAELEYNDEQVRLDFERQIESIA